MREKEKSMKERKELRKDRQKIGLEMKREEFRFPFPSPFLGGWRLLLGEGREKESGINAKEGGKGGKGSEAYSGRRWLIPRIHFFFPLFLSLWAALSSFALAFLFSSREQKDGRKNAALPAGLEKDKENTFGLA